jgi:hypothetical protein
VSIIIVLLLKQEEGLLEEDLWGSERIKFTISFHCFYSLLITRRTNLSLGLGAATSLQQEAMAARMEDSDFDG